MEPFSHQDYSIRHQPLTDNHGKTDLTRSPVVELPDSFERYLQHKTSANTRQKIRRIQRNISDDPELTIELASNDTIERYLVFFERVWTESWKALKGRKTRQLAQKYAEFIRLGMRSGDMLVPILLHESNPVGMLACYTDSINKQLLFFVAGRDADFSLLQSGLALHVFCIEWAIENGYTRYDLLRGDEPYKYSLGATDLLLGNTVMYKRAPQACAQLLNKTLVKQALALMAKKIGVSPDADIHQYYSQLLESWPGNCDVLGHYASWLESIEQHEHAVEITQSLGDTTTANDALSSAMLIDSMINVKPYTDIQLWCSEVKRLANTIETTGTLFVKGLGLEIAATEPESFQWLQTYLNPMLDIESKDQGCSGSNLSNYRLVCINTNRLIIDMMRLAKSDAIDVNTLYQNGRRIQRIYFNTNLVIDINKADGVIWVSDAKSREVTLLVSSRARWPALEVSSTARAIIIAYLQQEGWLFLHSGAAQINGENCLVIGDSGQGKTSLLLALMSAGCGFIANERVFVRKRGNQIEALSFPMPVAIGLGAAQQYPQIMEYVHHTDNCLYPQRRMDRKKLRSTSEAKWPSLSDKAQLLAPELCAAFSPAESLQGGLISGVVVPAIQSIDTTDHQDKVTVLDKQALRGVVRRNYISIKQDTRYPAWLCLAFNDAPDEKIDDLLDTICSLPGVQFEYVANKQRKEAVAAFPSLIHAALRQ